MDAYTFSRWIIWLTKQRNHIKLKLTVFHFSIHRNITFNFMFAINKNGTSFIFKFWTVLHFNILLKNYMYKLLKILSSVTTFIAFSDSSSNKKWIITLFVCMFVCMHICLSVHFLNLSLVYRFKRVYSLVIFMITDSVSTIVPLQPWAKLVKKLDAKQLNLINCKPHEIQI